MTRSECLLKENNTFSWRVCKEGLFSISADANIRAMSMFKYFLFYESKLNVLIISSTFGSPFSSLSKFLIASLTLLLYSLRLSVKIVLSFRGKFW